MSLTTIKKYQPQNIVSIETSDCSYWKKFGNLIQSITITTLDAFFLLGSIFPSIPKIFTNIAFSALNFSGLLSWSFYVDQTKKNIEDVCFSLKKNNHLMTFASILKTIFVATSIGLTFLNCGAAAFRLGDRLAVTEIIYTFIQPFGLPFLIISLGLDALYYYIQKQMLKNQLSNEDLILFYQNFSQTNCQKNKLESHASYVRGCVDKDTWKDFTKHLPNISADKRKQQELYNRVIIPNIATQQIASISNLFLRILGEIGMYISIINPGTVIQAACWTFLSFLYTSQLLYQHYNQHKHRTLTSAITFS